VITVLTVNILFYHTYLLVAARGSEGEEEDSGGEPPGGGGWKRLGLGTTKKRKNHDEWMSGC